MFETTHQGRTVWRGVIDVGFTDDGRRKQRAVQGKTKAEVQAKLARMKRERDSLGRVLDRATRFEDAAAAWLEEVAQSTRPKTFSNYRSQLRVNVNPSLGRKIAADLTPGDIRRMHVAIRTRGGGDANVAAAHRVAVSVLEWCRRERMIGENVASLMPPKRTKAGKAKGSLTREEARALLKLEDPRWTLSLLTGMRSGEALGLRIKELDFDNACAWVSWERTDARFRHGCGAPTGKKDEKGRTIYPCRRLTAGTCPDREFDLAADLEFERLQGRHVLVRPKNYIAREVPLRPEAIHQLQVHLTEGAVNPHGLVWHRSDGAPMTNAEDNAALRAALRRAGIDRPEASTHWLRHSYTTLAEHAGIPHAAYAGVSGHSSEQASDPYRHALTAEGRRAVNTLAEWLRS
ncbi:MAG: tyrosine-type recombinase/integrase [Humibacter sp.]